MFGNDEDRLTSDKVEAALSAYEVMPARIDRDTLMYRAGYAAASHGRARPGRTIRLWQATTGLMTAATVSLALMQFGATPDQPATSVVQREPATEVDSPPVAGSDDSTPALPTAPTVRVHVPRSPLLLADPSTNYLALRAAVLWRGAETWPTDYREPARPAPRAELDQPATARDLLDELLPAAPVPAADDESTEASSQTEEESIV